MRLENENLVIQQRLGKFAMKLRDIGEFGFIQRIRGGCLLRDENIIRGIGDDCCVFKTSKG